MGFRNPITTAIDPYARDLAADAYEEATRGIIPGTRLAADAIDGMTITGAVLRTPSGRFSVDDAGLLRAVNAIISGLLRTAEAGPRIELEQAPVATGTAGSSGWVRLHSGIGGVAPAGMTYDVTATTDGDTVSPTSTQLFISGGAGPTDGAYVALAERQLPAGGWESVADVVAQRMYVGAGLMHGPGEWSTTGGMRSAWHAWAVDSYDLRFVAPTTSWTGVHLFHYVVRGGWCWLTFRLDRASWAANAPVTNFLPAAIYPLVTADVACTHPVTGAHTGTMRIRQGDGAVYMTGAGSGGISGSTVFPVRI